MTNTLRDAFGFEPEPFELPYLTKLGYKTPKPSAAVISARNLHSDKIMAGIWADIPGFLKKYFDFPDNEYPETNGTVPHVVNLLKNMYLGGKMVAEFATDHCKSEGASRFFPIMSLASDPDEAHIIVGANDADSKRRIQVVQRDLEGNHQLIKDFPWLKKPPKLKDGGSGGVAWSRKELTISGRSSNRPNPSIYACATGSNDIRGRRGKLIMDDIEGEEHRHYALKRRQLYDFVKLEAVRCLEDTHESKRPLLIALGTPFDQASIYFRLEQEDWKLMKVSAYTQDWEKIRQSAYMKLADGKQSNTTTPWAERAALLPDKYFTWPRKRFKITSQDPYFGKGMTKAQFSIAYLLDPSAGDPTRLSLQQMQRLVSETDFPQEGDWTTVVSLDPAAGVKTHFADYAGISVVKIRWPRDQKLPETQVLEAHRFEQGLFEQVGFCADLCAKYSCDLVYESNAQQGGTYANAFSHLRPEVRLIPVYTTHGAKFDTEMGLTVIRTLVKERRLMVPEGQLDSEGMRFLLEEVRDLGTEKHDHITCSVWFVVNWLYQQVRAYNGPKLVSVSANSALSWRTWRR